MAIAAAESNPAIRQRLGGLIKRSFFISENTDISVSSSHTDLSIPVSGPRGKATIYAVVQKSAGLWKFESLDSAFDQTSSRMTVLNEG